MTETPPPPLPRSIRLLRRPSRQRYGIFSIRVGDTPIAYYVFRPIPCDIGGRGFTVYRLGRRRAYHVRVGPPDDCSCECLGYLYKRRCRHIQGLLTLMRRGKL
jgi:hypothetical protein